MRKYSQSHTVVMHQVDEVICNACGKVIEKNASGYFQDYVHIEKQWGYFSGMDGECHSLDMCEECYNRFIDTLAVPVEKTF